MIWVVCWSDYDELVPLAHFPDLPAAKAYVANHGSTHLTLMPVPPSNVGPSPKWIINYHLDDPSLTMIHEVAPTGEECEIPATEASPEFWLEIYAPTKEAAIARFEATYHRPFMQGAAHGTRLPETSS